MSLMPKLMEINDELVRVREERDRLREERDQAVENAVRLQAELAATHEALQRVCSTLSPKSAEQSDLVRDVSHYTEAAEVDRPTEPQPEQDGVLVQEGWWQQAGGGRVYVRPTNPSPDNIWRINIGFKWSDGARLYMDDGSHNRNQTTPHDLVKFLGKHVKTQPAEPQQHPAEYTPPEGWRVLRYGELLQPGDQWVNWEGTESRPDILHGDGATVSGGRYIRKIEGQAEPVQVREGRWRTRSGMVRYVTAMPTDHEDFAVAYPWWDGDVTTWANNGVFFNGQTAGEDLVAYLGPLKQEPQPEPQFKPYTFAAYIVGDKSQPDALRIVWATEEWIQHAKFGIVHRMTDTQSFETLTLNLKIQ